MSKMIEMTKTPGWAMLAEWQSKPNQNVHLKLYGSMMDIRVEYIKDNALYTGKASGSINLIDDVVGFAFANLAMEMRRRQGLVFCGSENSQRAFKAR